MRRLPLAQYNRPDLSNHLVHFVARGDSWPPTGGPPESVRQMTAHQRLGAIIRERIIRAFRPFGSDAPAVCFTESTRSAIAQAVRTRPYEPYGIGFTKEFVFDRGGGPAFYVRGDEWPHVSAMPAGLRFRATRYWPGSVREREGEDIPWYLNTCEWYHEREWRAPAEPQSGGLSFQWSDVAFLVLPATDELSIMRREGVPIPLLWSRVVVIWEDGSVEDNANLLPY